MSLYAYLQGTLDGNMCVHVFSVCCSAIHSFACMYSGGVWKQLKRSSCGQEYRSDFHLCAQPRRFCVLALMHPVDRAMIALASTCASSFHVRGLCSTLCGQTRICC